MSIASTVQPPFDDLQSLQRGAVSVSLGPYGELGSYISIRGTTLRDALSKHATSEITSADSVEVDGG